MIDSVVEGVKKSSIGLTVHFIAQDGKTQVLQVDADLVGSSRHGFGADQAVGSHSLENRDIGPRGKAIGVHATPNSNSGSMGSSDWAVHDDAVPVRPSMDDRVVGLGWFFIEERGL